MKIFDSINTKKELDEYLDNGVSGDAYRLFGASACNFQPFSDSQTEEETLLREVIESAPAEITMSTWAVVQLLNEKYTTVYRGIKFYFESGTALKRFCDLVEQKEQQ